MMLGNDKEKEVFQFFEEQVGEPVYHDTSINHDLEISGLDAELLMIDFSDKFKVDLKGFEFGEYFLEEGEWIFFLWKWLFKIKDPEKESLTIEHMIKVAESGHWIAPAGPGK